MEEKYIRELSLDEMDKVNGGNNTVKNTSEDERPICPRCGEDRLSSITHDYSLGFLQLKCDTCGQIFFPD